MSFGKVWKILRKVSNGSHTVLICARSCQQPTRSPGWRPVSSGSHMTRPGLSGFCGVTRNGLFSSKHQTRKHGEWAPENPHNIVERKRAHGKKVMAWVGIVYGKCLEVHWFEGPVDGAAYLEMLKTVVWPAVRHHATRLQYWFQQDGAFPHVTAPVMEFLRAKFGDRIISRNSEHHCTGRPTAQTSRAWTSVSGLRSWHMWSGVSRRPSTS